MRLVSPRLRRGTRGSPRAEPRSEAASARPAREPGQSLVEFALGITIFVTLMIGLVDLARAAFLYNGVADASRELARVTSVHPGTTLGTSTETTDATTSEQGIVPGLTVTSFDCIDIAGSAVTLECKPGDWVKVSVSTSFYPIMPLLSSFGPFTFSTASSAKIQ